MERKKKHMYAIFFVVEEITNKKFGVEIQHSFNTVWVYISDSRTTQMDYLRNSICKLSCFTDIRILYILFRFPIDTEEPRWSREQKIDDIYNNILKKTCTVYLRPPIVLKGYIHEHAKKKKPSTELLYMGRLT